MRSPSAPRHPAADLAQQAATAAVTELHEMPAGDKTSKPARGARRGRQATDRDVRVLAAGPMSTEDPVKVVSPSVPGTGTLAVQRPDVRLRFGAVAPTLRRTDEGRSRTVCGFCQPLSDGCAPYPRRLRSSRPQVEAGPCSQSFPARRMMCRNAALVRFGARQRQRRGGGAGVDPLHGRQLAPHGVGAGSHAKDVRLISSTSSSRSWCSAWSIGATTSTQLTEVIQTISRFGSAAARLTMSPLPKRRIRECSR